MNFHDFLGQVQHRAQLRSMDEALRATRATLTTLSERLQGREPWHWVSSYRTRLPSF